MDAGSVLHAPEALSDHEAGGLMEATLTAYLNIFEIGGAKSGQMVLIHGGGSGVGTQVAPRVRPARLVGAVDWSSCDGPHPLQPVNLTD